MNNVFLTKDEKQLFQGLPANLTKDWEVLDEIQNSYESPAVLSIRRAMSTLGKFPQVGKIVQNVRQSEVEKVSLEGIPDQILTELCFTIGAVGVSVLMQAILRKAESEDDLQALMTFGHLRHDLLETNASITK